jgi:lipoprotein-anchoring transpeptidase ErfK/SrfK
MYLVGASAFGVAIALQRNPDWGRAASRAGDSTWASLRQGAASANEHAVKPAWAKVVEWDKQFFDYIDPPKRIARTAPKQSTKVASVPAAKMPVQHMPRVVVTKKVAPPPALRPAISEPPPAQVATAEPQKPAMTLAPPEAQADAPAALPDLKAPSPAELTRVMVRLKDSLTSEMLENFELFLYVSKAQNGPWAQRMYVFKKQASGGLNLVYNWPVSTGREIVEFTPGGKRAPSFTPQGYYELDPDRMYRHHTSGQWGTPMPYAMFFNWQVGGLQTGLAIHAAHGTDMALLGQRASAGCVRLAPDNAAQLFNLIRTQYRGLAPRFAVDRRTATMSNQGLLMHDAQGRVQLADGYKVLVFIENYGGDNVVAAVF